MKTLCLTRPFQMVKVVILTILKSGAAVLGLSVRAYLFDAVVRRDWNDFLLFLGIVIGLKLIGLGLDYVQAVSQEQWVQLLNGDFRLQIVDRIGSANYMEVHKRPLSEYVSWLSNDIEKIAKEGVPMFVSIVECLSSIVFSVAVLFTYHWSIVGQIALSIVLLLYFPRLWEKKTQAAIEHYSQVQGRFLSNIKNLLEGYSVFYAFNKMRQFEKRVETESAPLADATVNVARTFLRVNGLTGALNLLTQTVTFVLAGYLIHRQLVSVGVLASVGGFAGTLYNQVALVSQSMLQIKSIQVYFDKFHSVEPDAQLQSTQNPVQHTLELRDVTIYRGDKRIVGPVSLTIENGKKYAIVGESGSGKTTLLQLLAGEDTHYTGEILADGQLLSPESAVQLRNATIHVHQKNHIFDGTVGDNISLWRDTIDWSGVATVHLDDICDLTDEVTENGLKMSGGQRQRIALARALSQPDKILLLDESTANLDQASAKEIEQQLLTTPGVTVVMITHHLFAEIRPLFDDILSLT